MSLTLSPQSRSKRAFSSATKGEGTISTPILVALGVLLSVIMTVPNIQLFMSTGFYLDPDDAMRMSQARDFMNGQGWFDLTSWRLDAPHGVFMHWTRIVDVPIALLTWFFQLFTASEMAERLTRLTLPLLMLGGLFAVSIRTGHLLIGRGSALVVTLLTIFSGAAFGYFSPGRLDHDHIAILALVITVGTLMRALDPAATGAAALAGLCIAFNLSVSLETLPFLIVCVATLPATWMFVGQRMGKSLAYFALALGGGLLVAFASLVAPARYLNGACDTLSAAHMVAGLAGAGLCYVLAIATPRLPTLGHRVGAGLAAGILTIAAVYGTYPACLADPYANLDPVLREMWLDNVSEARPLLKAAAMRPTLWLMLVLPILIGLAGTLWATCAERGTARIRWIALSAVVLAGCAAMVWQVRASGVVMPLALFGAAYAVVRVCRGLSARSEAWGIPAMALASLLISPIFLASLAPEDTSPAEIDAAKKEVECRTQKAFSAIAALPKSILLAPIDTGGHLLARTPHGVIAAPFHRNEHGNRLALDAFRADPAAAEAIVRGSGARYIAFCPGINDLELYHKIAPGGLGATLDDGKVPGWLTQLTLDTPYKVFEIR